MTDCFVVPVATSDFIGASATVVAVASAPSEPLPYGTGSTTFSVERWHSHRGVPEPLDGCVLVEPKVVVERFSRVLGALGPEDVDVRCDYRWIPSAESVDDGYRWRSWKGDLDLVGTISRMPALVQTYSYVDGGKDRRSATAMSFSGEDALHCLEAPWAASGMSFLMVVVMRQSPVGGYSLLETSSLSALEGSWREVDADDDRLRVVHSLPGVVLNHGGRLMSKLVDTGTGRATIVGASFAPVAPPGGRPGVSLVYSGEGSLKLDSVLLPGRERPHRAGGFSVGRTFSLLSEQQGCEMDVLDLCVWHDPIGPEKLMEAAGALNEAYGVVR